MRCSNIEVNFKIPVPIDKPDGNGIIYTEEAVIKACNTAECRPIIQYDSNGKEVIIGIANKVKYSDGFILVEGIVRHGGTEDTFLGNGVSLLEKGAKITNMRINCFGLSE